MSPEVSEHPRREDIRQLESAYADHRTACACCKAGKSCDMAKRMEGARGAAGDES